ncbi:MAG: dihydroorotase [Ruminococcaceae bacterium]|nr:dihydroorotase [Oscillospiraceae bacterium]
MKLKLQKVNFYKDGAFLSGDYLLNLDSVACSNSHSGGIVSNLNNCFIFPAFCDVHVHLREPGFSYKETIKTGTLAAARGGYSDVCSMPNLNPVPDSAENLKVQTDLIKSGAVINVHPYASITVEQKGEVLSDFEAMAKDCIAFSDDGRGVQSQELMRQAMLKAKKLGKIIVAHCEDNSLLQGGYIHDGEYAKLHGHKGICSESEWKPIERDLALAKETGCKYHVCHISCKESVELIRKAKADGVDVTCETAPHYLVMNDMMLKEDGRFKMNPPIRSEEDRLALIEGLKDGTIDMIATDHAPHSYEEKSKGLDKSLMGVVGLETAFSVLYTRLVKTNIITLERLVEVMAIAPRKRFNIEYREGDICVFDLNKNYVVNPDEFLSLGKATPFKNEKLFGVCKLTVANEKIVYTDSI